MGTRVAPSYANQFVGHLEEKMLRTAPQKLTPAFYGRFIDDIFGVWLRGEAAFKRFVEHANGMHDGIRFTYSLGQSVNFLDVTATLTDGQISTDLFTTETDTHQYLFASNKQPSTPRASAHTLRAGNSATGHRLRRNNSYETVRGVEDIPCAPRLP